MRVIKSLNHWSLHYTNPVGYEESSATLTQFAVKVIVIVLMHPKLYIIVAVIIITAGWIFRNCPKRGKGWKFHGWQHTYDGGVM